MDLLQFIPTGRANAVTARPLAARASYPNVRTLQADIHRRRVQGELILSATDEPTGYFYPGPGDDSDVERFLRSMKSRVREINAAAWAAEQYLGSLRSDEGRPDLEY